MGLHRVVSHLLWSLEDFCGDSVHRPLRGSDVQSLPQLVSSSSVLLLYWTSCSSVVIAHVGMCLLTEADFCLYCCSYTMGPCHQAVDDPELTDCCMSAAADVVLLDDPLSAVDAHVGSHLMTEAICRLLCHLTHPALHSDLPLLTPEST